jgi:DNA-binding response OmpR family regulator
MRVLIVEDEQNIAKYLKQGLKEQGYAVDLAYTGLESLDWIDVVKYDIILLDILLPEMDGFTVCQEIRKRNVWTPVLMLTARDAIDDRVTGLDVGADDYLCKPFALRELLARIRALSRRTMDGPRTTLLEVGDLILDTVSQEVRRSNRLIELTTKELSILEYLMREPGRVYSRSEIAEHVWNFDADNQSNVIDVYIRNLRRKIDDAYEPKLIHTIRGSGYRIKAEEDAEIS